VRLAHAPSRPPWALDELVPAWVVRTGATRHGEAISGIGLDERDRSTISLASGCGHTAVPAPSVTATVSSSLMKPRRGCISVVSIDSTMPACNATLAS
jgi:hypothetical protein